MRFTHVHLVDNVDPPTMSLLEVSRRCSIMILHKGMLRLIKTRREPWIVGELYES